jgi:hypothetical protein
LAAVVAVVVGAVVALSTGSAGVDTSAGQPSGSASHAASAASPAPSRPPLVRFDPTAADRDNLEIFGRALTKAGQSTTSQSVTAKTLIDALVDAGFTAGPMQRTADQTSANLQAPTLTVSVRLGGVCLIGQFVRSDASISTELAAPIGTGACLIGQTSPLG